MYKALCTQRHNSNTCMHEVQYQHDPSPQRNHQIEVKSKCFQYTGEYMVLICDISTVTTRSLIQNQ